VVPDGTGSSIGRAGPAPEYEKGAGVKKVASEAQALAKLKRQATDLHEQVRAGQATTQAARQLSGSPVDVPLDGLPAGGNATKG
jgi:hypothetical protein